MGAEATEGRRADSAVVPKGPGHAGNEAEGEGGVEDSKVSHRNAVENWGMDVSSFSPQVLSLLSTSLLCLAAD
jgi:hypothetical protein